MTKRSAWRRFLAGSLVIGFAGSSFGAGPVAGTAALLAGKVYDGASRTPLAGVTVYAADKGTGDVYPGGPTAEDGSFDLREIPPATYDLAVGLESGLYLVGTPVVVEPGRERRVVLLVHPAHEPAAPENPTVLKRPGVWNNPLTAALIVLGSALVVGALVDSATDDTDVSPSAPQ